MKRRFSAATVFFLLPSLLLSLLLTDAAAQQRTVRKSIDDDGRKLIVEIDIDQPGEPVHFRGNYNVARMSKRQKERLIDHLLDSLQLPKESNAVALLDGPERANPAPINPASAVVRASQPCPQNTALVASASVTETPTSPAASPVASTESGLPYTRSVEENRATGQLRMRYEYKREGDERVFERTVDVRTKSKAEKKRLIEETDLLFSHGLTPQAW